MHRIGLLDRKEVSKLGESIHYNQYAVVLPRGGQSTNEIHGDQVPTTLGDWQQMKQPWILCSVRLGLLENFTRLDVILNVLLHSWPHKQVFDPSIGSWES